MEDARITELFFERNEQALRETRAKYGKYCTGIAFNILKTQEDAEEVLSDTLLNAWNAIPPARPNSLKAYIGRVARNLAFNKYQSRSAKMRGGGEVTLALDELCAVFSDRNSVEKQCDTNRLTELLNRFLGELPSDTRTVFVKRYWYMQSVKEISRNMGFSESKTKMLLLRTREKLKDFLEQEDYYL